MKANPQTTKFDRLRTIIGWTLTMLGVFTVIVVGTVDGYHHATIWVAGLLLIVSGVMIAKSVELAHFCSFGVGDHGLWYISACPAAKGN